MNRKDSTKCADLRSQELLEPIRPRIRQLQEEIDEIEWMGLAPEKLSDKLNELQYLQNLEAEGKTYVPLF